jgi:hypothetical protein
MLNQAEVEKFIDQIEQTFPPIFARHSLTKLSGGLINSATLANKMSRGDGPPGIRFGRNVGFTRESFIAWLKEGHLQKIK